MSGFDEWLAGVAAEPELEEVHRSGASRARGERRVSDDQLILAGLFAFWFLAFEWLT